MTSIVAGMDGEGRFGYEKGEVRVYSLGYEGNVRARRDESASYTRITGTRAKTV